MLSNYSLYREVRYSRYFTPITTTFRNAIDSGTPVTTMLFQKPGFQVPMPQGVRASNLLSVCTLYDNLTTWYSSAFNSSNRL